MVLLLPLKAASIAVGLNYGTYVTASYAFKEFCIPGSVWDIPVSFLTAASPACSFLVSVIQTTQNNFAVAFVSTLTTLAASALRP
jgi:hypothetical protein